jgi:Fur family transcriptional regulator, peroxide stress response regulator
MVVVMTISKYRYSRQREAILNLLGSGPHHLTAEEIHERVRHDFPNLSLGTVYRNLRILQQVGQVRELVYDGGSSHYEARREPHYHVVCQQCRRVEDVLLPGGGSLDRRLIPPAGWQVREHRLEFFGLCDRCITA